MSTASVSLLPERADDSGLSRAVNVVSVRNDSVGVAAPWDAGNVTCAISSAPIGSASAQSTSTQDPFALATSAASSFGTPSAPNTDV